MYCLVLLAMPVVYLASVRSSLSAPFWFDEQWVANNLSLPGHFWIIPIQNQAPVAAGWFFLARGVSLLVGSTESTLRSVGAAAFIAAFPLIFFYSRRFVGNFTAFVFAPLVMFSSLILSYVLQLKEYEIDISATVLILILFRVGSTTAGPRRTLVMWACGAGTALCCCASLPAIFVLAPLMGLVAYRVVRARRLDQFSMAQGVASLVALVHMKYFVLAQNQITQHGKWNPHGYWFPQFFPSLQSGKAAGFVVGGFFDFFRLPFVVWRNFNVEAPVPTIGNAAAWLLGFVVLLSFLVGLISLLQSRGGQELLAATLGSLLLLLVGSMVHRWPWGFERTNLFVVPLIYLVALVGLYRVARFMPGRWVPLAKVSAGARLLALGARILVGVLAVSFVMFDMHSISDSRATLLATVKAENNPAAISGTTPYGSELRSAVAEVAQEARSKSIVLVVFGDMAIQGWHYYQFEYGGNQESLASRVSAARTYFTLSPASAGETQRLATFQPDQLDIYLPAYTPWTTRDVFLNAAKRAGYCSKPEHISFTDSGDIYVMGRGCR